eukprot:GHVU01072166.1.p1 GENE.GHVU01072166.1~~GHVU01072166.1.p1  ORF type:complete len:289 (-),score=23.24 GHVU01072166.1:501-1367(-)
MENTGEKSSPSESESVPADAGPRTPSGVDAAMVQIIAKRQADGSRHPIDVCMAWTVRRLKRELHTTLPAFREMRPKQMRLVHDGVVLESAAPLTSYKIEPNSVVFVLKCSRRPKPSSSSSAAAVITGPPPPDAMETLMANPMMQAALANKDVLREILENNPQVKQLRDKNPELDQALGDPQVRRRLIRVEPLIHCCLAAYIDGWMDEWMVFISSLSHAHSTLPHTHELAQIYTHVFLMQPSRQEGRTLDPMLCGQPVCVCVCVYVCVYVCVLVCVCMCVCSSCNTWWK